MNKEVTHIWSTKDALFKCTGRVVTSAGFSEFEFVIYQPEFELGDLKHKWRVCEVTTGCYFADGNTPNEVMKLAKETLIENGRKTIRKTIKEFWESDKGKKLTELIRLSG